MDIQDERIKRILEIAAKKGRIHYAELALILGLSPSQGYEWANIARFKYPKKLSIMRGYLFYEDAASKWRPP